MTIMKKIAKKTPEKGLKMCSRRKRKFCAELDRLLGFNNDWSRTIRGFSAIELTNRDTLRTMPIQGVMFRGKGRSMDVDENVLIKFCPFCATDLNWRTKKVTRG